MHARRVPGLAVFDSLVKEGRRRLAQEENVEENTLKGAQNSPKDRLVGHQTSFSTAARVRMEDAGTKGAKEGALSARLRFVGQYVKLVKKRAEARMVENSGIQDFKNISNGRGGGGGGLIGGQGRSSFSSVSNEKGQGIGGRKTAGRAHDGSGGSGGLGGRSLIKPKLAALEKKMKERHEEKVKMVEERDRQAVIERKLKATRQREQEIRDY